LQFGSKVKIIFRLEDIHVIMWEQRYRNAEHTKKKQKKYATRYKTNQTYFCWLFKYWAM